MILPATVSARLRQAYHELLLWGIYARERRIDAPHAESLHHFAMERVRTWRDVLAEIGIERNQPLAAQWFRDAERVLVAFFDAAARSLLGETWLPLQRQLYGHERLGQEVFERIETLAQSPIPAEAPTEALEVFERCLRLGYHGGTVDRRMAPEFLDRFESKLVAARYHTPPPLAPGLPKLALQRRWVPMVGPLGILGMALALLLLLGGWQRLSIYLRTSDLEAAVKTALANHPDCHPGLDTK